METVLYLDVDGVLNPWRAKRPHEHFASYRRHTIAGYRLWLTAEHGPLLTALGVRIVWATSWCGIDDLERIAELTGLPTGLERLTIDQTDLDAALRDCGKLPAVRAHVETHNVERFVWIDDDLGPADRAYAALDETNRLLLRPDPSVGLRRADIEHVADWLAR